MRPATAPNWIRNVDDVAQQIKAMELETQSIKEKRRKEFETRQLAVDKEVEDCLRRVRDERETAIRIREEAIRQAQLEKEKAAKAEEEKAKAIVAQKQAQDKKAAEEAAAAEKAQKAEKDKKAAAAAAAEKAKNAAAAGIADASSNTGSNFVSETALVEYKRYMDLLTHLKTVAVPAVENDPAIRKFCAGIRREIMPSIGQLINKQHEIIRVAMEIDQQFKKAMQTQNENVYYWVLNFTAKKLTKQAEGEALVKAAPAFPLAHVAVLLFTNHPRFMDVLLARFVKKCPYTAPLYMSKESSESPDEFLHRLGYKKKEKRLENEAEYNGRQCAIFTLYCAIMQTNPPAGRNLYPLSNGWTWMSRVLNMPPRPITPSLITVFLEVCGERYLRTYGNQARKVIQLLVNEFIPLIPRQGKDGTTRLKTLLEEYLRTGQFSVVEGREFDR
ncbi:MAG: GLE1-like protein-domain-containing protein [Benniella sp.]|nr:MAG: GLE1-like protein-domain-containing protein [Benniella sp.]